MKHCLMWFIVLKVRRYREGGENKLVNLSKYSDTCIKLVDIA